MLPAVTVTEEEKPRWDRRRDLPGWLATPLVTLLLAPGLAISVGILAAESSTTYPGLCRAAEATNGCEETVFAMFVLHARIFLAGWLLLWAVPWWRGLRRIRIAAAVVFSGVLLAAPVRLVDWSNPFDWSDLFGRWPLHGRDTVALLLAFGLPIAGFVWSAFTHRPWLAAAFVVVAIIMGLPAYAVARHRAGWDDHQSVTGGNSRPCIMHSGSHDVCPGG